MNELATTPNQNQTVSSMSQKIENEKSKDQSTPGQRPTLETAHHVCEYLRMRKIITEKREIIIKRKENYNTKGYNEVQEDYSDGYTGAIRVISSGSGNRSI